ncbi:MgtC/SapB family protein [Spirochaeta lutea]|uniref:MgtC/SapB family protein n=1 Tax=Spirochaeta lutea TaxID=1480694 RepID=UPI00068F6075|nr:MgtC/SapB family protein [Spirochaeta lutea]
MDLLTWLSELFTKQEIQLDTLVLRLALSAIFGGMVGLERERKNQAAGLRTHLLICLGATILMMLSIYMAQAFPGDAADPSRIAAQVVSGIGFLGAGAIVRMGLDIRGLTTAASIWVVAAIGLVTGAGMYAAAVIAVGIVLFALGILERISTKVFPKAVTRRLSLSGEGLQERVETIRGIIEDQRVEIHGMSIDYQVKKEGVTMHLDVLIPKDIPVNQLVVSLSDIPGVKRVNLEFHPGT